jgi:hypothetical protein
MMLPGAHRRCIETSSGGGRGAWLRYLQDHATKRKQEQIVENIGRHWGVVGRTGFVEVLPDVACDLTYKDYATVVRWMQRLATPHVMDARCPFGYRLGYRISRGRWGRSVWFSSTNTVARMVEFLRSSHG